MNTIEIPLSFATAGLVGLGGLAFLMGAVLLLVAELLAVLRERRNWASSGARAPGSLAGRPGVHRSQAGTLVTTVLARENGSDAGTERERGLSGPRVAA